MLKRLSAAARTDRVLEALDADGAVIVEDLISRDHVQRVRGEVEALVVSAPFGSEWGGRKTKRSGALVAAAPSCRELVMNPLTLAAGHAFLERWSSKLTLNLTQAVCITPGEKAQLIHRDRAFLGAFPRSVEPHLNIIWAITDFTAENGATQVAPGSHRWQAGRTERAEDLVPAEMNAGSALIYSSSVLHGGGQNRSDAPRLGIIISYGLSWLRQTENQYLSCPPSIARGLDPALRALLGYTMSDVGMGHFAGLDGRIQRPEVAVGDYSDRPVGLDMVDRIEESRQDG